MYSLVPEGQVNVKVKAVDAQGRGVSGKSLDFLSSAGTFDSLRDAGGGDYEITLTVAENATGDVKIHVNAPSGAMAMAKLGLTDAVPEETTPANAWGAVDENAAPVGPIVAAPVTPEKEKKPAKAKPGRHDPGSAGTSPAPLQLSL